VLLNNHIGVLFLVRCVLEFRCGWVGVVSVLQAAAQIRVKVQMHLRSQWPRGLRRGSAVACLLRLWVRNSPGEWMSAYCNFFL